MTSLRFQFDPPAVRLTSEEILADLLYPAVVKAAPPPTLRPGTQLPPSGN